MGQDFTFEADARYGCLSSTAVTLSATPNTVTSIVIPKDAKGFGLYPAAKTIRYNVGATVVAEAALGTTDQDGVASDMADGGYAFAASWLFHRLEDFRQGATRMLYLLSADASAVVYVEFF